MSWGLLWPGKQMKTSESAPIARHTLLIVRQIVALFRCSASPTECRKLPPGKSARPHKPFVGHSAHGSVLCSAGSWGPAVCTDSGGHLQKICTFHRGGHQGRPVGPSCPCRPFHKCTSASSSTMSCTDGHAIVRAGGHISFWAFIWLLHRLIDLIEHTFVCTLTLHRLLPNSPSL